MIGKTEHVGYLGARVKERLRRGVDRDVAQRVHHHAARLRLEIALVNPTGAELTFDHDVGFAEPCPDVAALEVRAAAHVGTLLSVSSSFFLNRGTVHRQFFGARGEFSRTTGASSAIADRRSIATGTGSYATCTTATPPAAAPRPSNLAPDRQAAIERGLTEARRALTQARPDVLLVVVGSDVAWDDGLVPSLTIYWGESVGNGADQRSVSPPLARHLIERLTWADFDVAQVRQSPAGRAVERAAAQVTAAFPAARGTAIVPIVVNTAIPPNQPTARRCIEIGKRIERALEECDCDTRIGLIGFGGFSPFAVDEDLNQAIARHLREGDEGALARLPRERLDAGMADLRPWLVVAGAAKALDVQVLDYRPWYDAGTTTGPSLGLISWVERAQVPIVPGENGLPTMTPVPALAGR
jgi:hypothetical protein